MSARKRGRGNRRASSTNQQTEADDEGEEQIGAFGILDLRHVSPELIFRFELGPALLDQLRTKLKSIPPVSLTEDIEAPYPGFYQIIYQDVPKYIGKAGKQIQLRLRKHYRTFVGRLGADPAHLKCKFAFVEDLSLVDMTEMALIRYFREIGEADWNRSGIGANVPGVGRKGTRRSKIIDVFRPDLQRDVTLTAERGTRLRQVVSAIDKRAPVELKIAKVDWPAFDASFPDPVQLPASVLPFQEWVSWIESQIAPRWRIHRGEMSWYIVPVDRA